MRYWTFKSHTRFVNVLSTWVTVSFTELSCQLCSYSRTSQHFKEPEGSLPCSQEPSTSPYQNYSTKSNDSVIAKRVFIFFFTAVFHTAGSLSSDTLHPYWGVLCSNLGWDTGCPDWNVSRYSPAPPCQCRFGNKRSLPNNLQFINHPTIDSI
jgi:hypothetical protein